MGVAAALAAIRAAEDRAHLLTGPARWIWCAREILQPAPVRFYAVRDFFLRRVPVSAAARVFGDRRWALLVNGSRAAAGEQRPGDPLRRLELAPLLRQGSNRLVIEAESPTGVGGILFGLDLGAEKNAVVSDAAWRIARSQSEVERGEGPPVAVWGRPPMYPWRYPK